MTAVFFEGPLGGNLGATRCSVYQLDPTGTVPIEPIPDILPGAFTPFRVTLDIIDQETMARRAQVSQHAVQDFLDVISHVHIQPRVLNVTGTLGAFPILAADIVPPDPEGFARFDLLRVKRLEALMNARQPLMVVTPRNSMAKAFLFEVSDTWSVGQGKQTAMTLSFLEARVVSPILLDQVEQDYPAQAPGNNAITSGGKAPTSALDIGATASPTPGVSPVFGAAP